MLGPSSVAEVGIVIHAGVVMMGMAAAGGMVTAIDTQVECFAVIGIELRVPGFLVSRRASTRTCDGNRSPVGPPSKRPGGGFGLSPISAERWR